MAIGGMRHPRHSVNKIPGLKKAGALVRQATDEIMAAHPHIIDQCCDACVANDREQVPAMDVISELKTRMNTLLGTSPRTLPTDPRVDTELDAQLLENWRHAAGDVDTDVPDWLSAGAASGINELPASKGVFPLYEKSPKEFRPLASYPEGFYNYKSVEEDPAAKEEVDKLTSMHYFDKYDDVHAAESELRGKVHLSNMAMITKEAYEAIKRRLILDCLASGINSITTQVERRVGSHGQHDCGPDHGVHRAGLHRCVLQGPFTVR